MEEGLEQEVCHERTTREGCSAAVQFAGDDGLVCDDFCARGAWAECDGSCDYGCGPGASTEFNCLESCGGPGDTGGCDGAKFFAGWRTECGAEFVTDRAADAGPVGAGGRIIGRGGAESAGAEGEDGYCESLQRRLGIEFVWARSFGGGRRAGGRQVVGF